MVLCRCMLIHKSTEKKYIYRIFFSCDLNKQRVKVTSIYSTYRGSRKPYIPSVLKQTTVESLSVSERRKVMIKTKQTRSHIIVT